MAAFVNVVLQVLTGLSYRFKKPNLILNCGASLILAYQLPNAARDIVALWGEGWLIQLSAVGFVCALAHPTIMVLRKPPTSVDMILEDGTRTRDGQRLLQNRLFGSFVNTTDAPYCEVYGEFMGPIRSHDNPLIRGSLLLDTYAGVACNIFDGLRSTGHCAGFSFAILGISVGMLIFVIGYKPLASKFDLRSAQIKAMIQTWLGTLTVVSIYDPEWTIYAEWTGMVLMCYFPVEFVISFALSKIDERKQKEYESTHVQTLEDPLLVVQDMFPGGTEPGPQHAKIQIPENPCKKFNRTRTV